MEVLLEAIDSALAQSHAPHEIIIVDDGSTDGTRNALVRYRENIRYLHQANSGVSVARNLGIRSATGDWIAFLDADDRWLPGWLEAAQLVAENHPRADFLYGRVAERFHSGRRILRHRRFHGQQRHHL